MKKSELIIKNRERISEAMLALERKVFEANGQIRYMLYMKDDGTIEPVEIPFGEGAFYITTVMLRKPATPWELTGTAIPDDPDERQERLEELIDYLVEAAGETIGDEIDCIIEDAKLEENEGTEKE